MTVRHAVREDTGRLLELLSQNAALHQLRRPDIFRANTRKYGEIELADMMGNPDKPIFVADGGAYGVSGYAMCCITRRRGHALLADRVTLLIEDLCVDSRLRRHGVGRLLFEACREYAVKHGAQAVELNVWECNPEALDFYRALGFSTQKRGMEMIL